MSPFTPNAITTLLNGNVPEGQDSIVQIINIKKIQADRYRVILSDGVHFAHGMMASQLYQLIVNSEVVENTVIRVKEYMTNLVQDKIVVILLGIDVLHTEQTRLGNPVECKPGDEASVAPNSHVNQPQAKSMYNNNNNNPYNNNNAHNNRKPEPTPSSINNPYGSPKSKPYQRPMSQNQPIVHSNASNVVLTPIASLNMYANRWTIKARVTTKNPIKEWNNAKGQGKLFSVSLLDSSEKDIRATFFKEAVDSFYNMLDVGGVYTFSGGRLKVANAQWNTCKSPLEISFDDKASIQKVQDEGNIKEQSFEFVKISQLESMEPGANVDLLTIVKSVGIPSTIISKKSSKELNKCDLVLVDDSGVEISLTLWGDNALGADQEYEGRPVVAFKCLRLGDYGGRSLSSSFNSSIQKEPRTVPEVAQLRSWWQSTGGSVSKSLSTVGTSRGDSFENRKFISSIKGEQLGFQEKPDWVSMKCTINFIKKDKEGGPWYTACPNADEPCKNRFKVTQTTDGSFHCDKCDKAYQNCYRKFIFSATITDDTCTTWVSMFDEQAKQLLGANITADGLHKRCFEGEYDNDHFDSVFAQAQFTDWIAKCRVKQEMVGDEERVKTTVYSLTPVDYTAESKELLRAIESM